MEAGKRVTPIILCIRRDTEIAGIVLRLRKNLLRIASLLVLSERIGSRSRGVVRNPG